MNDLQDLITRWSNGIDWSLGLLELNQPDFRLLRKILRETGNTVLEGQGDEFNNLLRSFLTAQMTVPCKPRQALHDSWMEDFKREGVRFSVSYPQHHAQIQQATEICEVLYDEDSLLVSGLEHICLEKGLENAVFAVRYGFSLEAVTRGLRESGLSDFLTVQLWRDLRRYGVNSPLVLGGPLIWHATELRIPPAANIIVVQPSGFPDSFNPSDPFAVPTGNNLSFAAGSLGPTAIVTDKISLKPVATATNTSDLTEHEFDLSENKADSFKHSPSHHAAPNTHQDLAGAIRLRFIDGTETIPTHSRYLFMISNNSLENREVLSSDCISPGWYLVSRSDISQSKLRNKFLTGQPKINSCREWWRKEMRTPAIAEAKFRNAGGVRAHRLSAWTGDDMVFPSADADFRAFLSCAHIADVDEQNRIIRVIRKADNSARQHGRERAAGEFEELQHFIERESFQDFGIQPTFSIQLNPSSTYQFSLIQSVDPHLV
jgi:hypothetical protein